MWNTRSMNPYIPYITALQTMIAACCCFAFVIRGTLSANAIVAKDKMPSTHKTISTSPPSHFQFARNLKQHMEIGKKLTHRRHNLRLQPQLIAKAPNKIRDPAFPIPTHIRHLADMIEHMPARKE